MGRVILWDKVNTQQCTCGKTMTFAQEAATRQYFLTCSCGVNTPIEPVDENEYDMRKKQAQKEIPIGANQ